MQFSTIVKEIEKAATYKPDGSASRGIAKIWGDYYSPYYRFFWKIAELLPKDTIQVELGVHNGRGLCSLAMGGKQVYGIDHTLIPELENNISHFSNIVFIQADSTPVPVQFDRPISLLHIDTEHSYSQAKVEFESYQPYLADNAIVIFDDLHAQEDAVLRYFYELPYQKMQVDAMHPVCGWGVLLWTK